jgi:membrane-associated phospholipid phosphatase
MRRKTVSRRSRDDAADLRELYVALFWPSRAGVALIIFVVFAFPRVMIGAHWFSDIAVGSLTAVLIGAPWVLMTPLSDKLIAFFDRYFPAEYRPNNVSGSRQSH